MLMGKQIYRAFSNSQKLNGAILSLHAPGRTQSISIHEAINAANHQGRTILVCEFVDSLEQSSLNNYDHKLVYREKRKINVQAGTRIELGDFDLDFVFPDDALADGEFEVNIVSFVNTPLIRKSDCIDEEKKKIVKFSELLAVYVIFSKKSDTEFRPAQNRYIYESYNQYGFLVVDVDRFDKFIIEKLGDGVHNIVQQLTTTEIAEELFARGLMVLCWGITPWVYMVNSHLTNQDTMFFPGNCDPICSGEYIFSRDIENVCVISGTELLNWETGTRKDWPKLKIEGTGDVVRLDLRILRAPTSVAEDLIPIPYFNIWRKEAEVTQAAPILNFDIFSGT
jgi:hypothetical protein